MHLSAICTPRRSIAAARGAIGAMRRNATPQRARRTQGNGSFTARHAADRPTHSLVARIME
ncbi:hypothetical protein WS86_00435 [Burkholderia savannae]|nr:hypothetical protein WS86_00435 [Burkholderia savannae]